MTETPSEIYRRYACTARGSVLLESARVSPLTGRYSLIAKDPFLTFESKGRRMKIVSYGATEELEGDPLEKIRQVLPRFSPPSQAALPVFTGGAVGYFAYELKDLLEPRLSSRGKDDLKLPDIYLLFFDEGVLVDHDRNRLVLFSNIRTGRDLKKNYRAGLAKMRALEKRLERSLKRPARRARVSLARKPGAIESSFSREKFVEKVSVIRKHIRRGDIFQANLSQRFSFGVHEPPFAIYEKLKSVNPSPFFGYLDAGRFQIICGSPERLVKLENGALETRPIAGTRSRGRSSAEDAKISRDLILNEKERAEHIMLVDLERNDMGRVAEYGSVLADELMTVEDYSHVKHIVSNVRGRLRPGLDAVDVLKAFFPGGTITGAPKVRCMEILDELEPVARGPYTGSLGYLGFNGNMDLNIIIRSLVVKDGKAYLQVGAGIVADSVPEKEYDETLYKAQAVLKAIYGEERTRAFFARCRA